MKMGKKPGVMMAALAAVTLLSACSTYTPQRYSISANNNVALREMNVRGISVGEFTGPKNFSAACRGAGPIGTPDGISFEEYIRQALISELKIAGVHGDKSPAVTLSGAVDNLEFSSTRGLTGGSWDIGLRMKSSNGAGMVVSEHYDFSSGFAADTACKQTAEAFMPAVQNLIEKMVKNADFKKMVTP